MCIVCAPEFRSAFEALSFPSRRNFLKGSGALAAGGVFLAEALDAARAYGEINEILTDGLIGAPAQAAAGPATIFTAREIISMEREAPVASAIAVAGKRIVAVGSLDLVKAALGARPYKIDETFNDKRPDARGRGHRNGGLEPAGKGRESGDDVRGLPAAAESR